MFNELDGINILRNRIAHHEPICNSVYLKTGKVKDDTRTPGLQEVKKKLQYLLMTLKECRAYDAHMDTIMVQNDVLDTAKEEGRAEGKEEGRKEVGAHGRAGVRIEVARKLVAMGLPDETVIEATGISAQEVAALRSGRDARQ